MLPKRKTKPKLKPETLYFLREIIGDPQERQKFKKAIKEITELAKAKDLDDALKMLNFVKLPYHVRAVLSSAFIKCFGESFTTINLGKDDE